MTVFEYDGSLRPMAVSYAVAASLFDGTRGEGFIELPGPALANLLRDDRRMIAVLWRQGGRRQRRFMVPLDASTLDARDMWGNPVTFKPTAAGFEMSLTGRPLYLIAPVANAKLLIDALGQTKMVRMTPMNAEIISIGDEIASGQLLDTNSQWLSQRLGELGIRVLYHTTVGDELDAGVDVFRQAIDRADVVVATGGLGPTADDLTREVLAQATGRGLVRDEEALTHIRQLFARRGWAMPEQNEVQAMLPEGSRLIPNPHGTAPGIAMDVPREGRSPCRLFALPGVPAEMVEMWEPSVAGALRSAGAGGRVIRHRLVKCFGAGESQIESMLPDLIRRGRIPRVGITASKTTIILRITAEGATDEECFAAVEPTVATIRQCLGELVFGEDEIELEDVVVRLLGERAGRWPWPSGEPPAE